MPNEVILAGAGSGKTYTVTHAIVDAIAQDEFIAGGILATTFTTLAADEMRARIREELRRRFDRDSDVILEFEKSRVGTVHSIGAQLVRSYHNVLGLPPGLRAIDEVEQKQLISGCIASDPGGAFDRFATACLPFGRDPRDTIFSVIQILGPNGLTSTDLRAHLKEDLARFLQRIHACSEGEATWSELLDAIGAFSREIPQTTKRDLEFLALRQELWDGQNYTQARKFVQPKVSKAAEKLASYQVMVDTARRFCLSSSLRGDLEVFVESLLDCVERVEQAYEQKKAELGVIDFGDQERLFLELITTHWKAIEVQMLPHLHLVVIDEFQDTNPMQMAIFQRLSKLAARTIWVGDRKQSIYGFRGASLEVIDQAIGLELDGEAPERLGVSYRSDAALVGLANRYVREIWGEEEALELKPEAGAGRLSSFEVPGKGRSKDWGALGDTVAAYFAELKPGSTMAVLTHRNRQSSQILQVLRDRNLPASGVGPGLLSTWECQVLTAGLRLLADPRDRLAKSNLERLYEGEELDVILSRRASDMKAQVELGDSVHGFGVVEAIGRVIAQLDLLHEVRRAGSADARGAGIQAFMALGQRYVQSRGDQGFAGSLSGFLAWLDELARDETDYFPAVRTPIQVLTVHKSKGLQWDHVFYVADPPAREDSVFDMRVEGAGVPGNPLEGRKLRWWVWPFGEAFGTRHHPGDLGKSLEDTDEARTVARLGLEERSRQVYVALTRAKHGLCLVTLEKQDSALQTLAPLGLRSVGPEDYEDLGMLPLRFDGPPPRTEDALAPARPSQKEAHPWTRAPSREGPWLSRVRVEAELAASVDRESLDRGDAKRLGELFHQAVVIWGLLRDRVAWRNEQAMRRQLSNYVGDDFDVRVEAFLAWLEGKGSPTFEVPFQAALSSGQVAVGQFDVLLEREEEVWVVDHKVARGKAYETLAQEYGGQLQVYMESARQLVGKPARAFLHLPYQGVILEVFPESPVVEMEEASATDSVLVPVLEEDGAPDDPDDD